MMAARYLFAEQYIDSVTLREIVKATGQKNQGSVNDYFGIKASLVLELATHGTCWSRLREEWKAGLRPIQNPW